MVSITSFKITHLFLKDFDFNYKNEKKLRGYITERGKILPRRMSGTCAKHQRHVAEAIKRARHLALIPYSGQTQY